MPGSSIEKKVSCRLFWLDGIQAFEPRNPTKNLVLQGDESGNRRSVDAELEKGLETSLNASVAAGIATRSHKLSETFGEQGGRAPSRYPPFKNTRTGLRRGA